MPKANLCIDELEELVKEGLVKKHVGEGVVYLLEKGEIVEKKVKDCVTYQTTGKAFICNK